MELSSFVAVWTFTKAYYLVRCKSTISLLQQTITWYKIRHTGGQAHYYSRTGTLKQRQVKLDCLRSLYNNKLALQYGGFCTM